MHEIIAPDMIGILWSQPDTCSVTQPEPPPLWWFHRHFQPLSSPQSLDTLVIHMLTSISEQCSDTPVAVAAKLADKLNHVRHKSIFICPTFGLLPLCGLMLAQDTTGSTL
ncbi:hypothetical protein IWQ55_004949 [Labrenzia sp. EL_208]|nr:hypothetical protein [Labrenzia sp. EL_132]MBG6231720.1 hypothetical protein [Labrenzia sp. EL_208]